MTAATSRPLKGEQTPDRSTPLVLFPQKSELVSRAEKRAEVCG